AAVEDKNLIASGHGARDPQRKPVGVGGGCGYLPERKAETRSQQVAEHQRIFGGEHVGKAASRLSADGARPWWWRVAEHRAGIAEAEVVERVAIDVGGSGASRLGDHDRKWRGPVCHPVHRHSVEETLDAIVDAGCRFRLSGTERPCLHLMKFCNARGGYSALICRCRPCRTQDLPVWLPLLARVVASPLRAGNGRPVDQ